MGDAGTMGETLPGAPRPPGASFTIEYLLSQRGDGGPRSPSAPGRPPRPPPEPGDKPAQSYIALISTAILSSPEKKLLLSDIYQWIMDNYPYFKNKVRGCDARADPFFGFFFPPFWYSCGGLGWANWELSPEWGTGLGWTHRVSADPNPPGKRVCRRLDRGTISSGARGLVSPGGLGAVHSGAY